MNAAIRNERKLRRCQEQISFLETLYGDEEVIAKAQSVHSESARRSTQWSVDEILSLGNIAYWGEITYVLAQVGTKDKCAFQGNAVQAFLGGGGRNWGGRIQAIGRWTSYVREKDPNMLVSIKTKLSSSGRGVGAWAEVLYHEFCAIPSFAIDCPRTYR